jgi:hypothetical protein
MPTLARLLFGGAYFVVLAYLVWPLVPGQGEVLHLGRQLAVLVIPLVSLAAVLWNRRRPLLYAALVLNGLVAMTCAGGLIIQAVVTGFDPLIKTDLPAMIFFLVFIPVTAVFGFRSALSATSPNQRLERP